MTLLSRLEYAAKIGIPITVERRAVIPQQGAQTVDDKVCGAVCTEVCDVTDAVAC